MYSRKAHYYETDQMGVVHHANFIHWIEEARVDFMDSVGFGYRQMEEFDITSPVLMVHCEYKKSVKFDDVVDIWCGVSAFDGVRMSVEYRIFNTRTNELVAEGESRHCFLGKNGRPISLKKALPEFYSLFSKLSVKDEKEIEGQ